MNMQKNRVLIYDTTLRDGAQAEGISFSIEDKILISKKLDDMGIDCVEGGWPISNPKDAEFFEEMKKINLKHSTLFAFGSTRHPKYKTEEDPNLQSLVKCGVKGVTIFGKSWALHVKEALKVSLDENLDIIYESITFLKSRVEKVFFDAEHFFDGFKDKPEYALKVLKAASDAKADAVVLCDTNGGTLPMEIENILMQVTDSISTPIGIHTHNDSETAVASTLAAVSKGACQVQGTINGYGERCGNANLCSIIPNLVLKMGKDCFVKEHLDKLRDVSLYVTELAMIRENTHQAYVGSSAFAHKGGIHVSAIEKNPKTYEHIEPQTVGNVRRILISELSGKTSVLNKAKDLGVDLKNVSHEKVSQIINKIKALEHMGYVFEGADASFRLLLEKELGRYKSFFKLQEFRVIVEKRSVKEKTISEATIKINIDEKEVHTVANGDGPVNALDRALRKALEGFYPSFSDVELLDYKVRIVDEHKGTRAVTRVLIESGDHNHEWGTVGVSENIIEASWQALVDSIEYKLLLDTLDEKPTNIRTKKPKK